MLRLYTVLSCMLATPVLADCEGVGEIAAAIMGHRQSDQLKSVSMLQVDALEDLTDPARNLLRDYVKQAYGEPVYFSQEAKRQAVNDFRNGVASECYRAMQTVGR